MDKIDRVRGMDINVDFRGDRRRKAERVRASALQGGTEQMAKKALVNKAAGKPRFAVRHPLQQVRPPAMRSTAEVRAVQVAAR